MGITAENQVGQLFTPRDNIVPKEGPMAPRLRRDESGVASTVATMLSLFVVLLFLEATVVAVVPAQQYNAEWVTSKGALQSLDLLRSTLAGPAMPGTRFSVALPLGTAAVSPFASASQGALTFDDQAIGGPQVSFRFVPHFLRGSITKVDQDVILLMDSSGSMSWNDPLRLRISGAKGYVGSLTYPDRVAIVDFDSCARFTRVRVLSCNSATGIPSSTTGVAHHLYAVGHNGDPDYKEAQGDVDLIDQSGGTNFGTAIQIANDEFRANGDPRHRWIMILLTDGQNNAAWQDALAVSEATEAAGLGIVIYTIGLSAQADAALLTQIATITGGTYYPAPTAESIRWIYFDISRRYAGAFQCGDYNGVDISQGALSLALGSRQYPAQTYRLEGGALTVLQGTGQAIHAGIPIDYLPSGPGSGTLSLTLLTFTGAGFAASGTDYQVLQADVVARDVEDQLITKVALDLESRAIGNISSEVQYWTTQGAATPTAEAAIRAPLNQANASASWAHANATAGRITQAKFNVDQAQARLTTAIQVTEDMLAQGQIQRFLAKQIQDEMSVEGCKLSQWANWYNGITITINSPAASAWAVWLNETFRNVGGGVSVGLAGTKAVVSIHAIDRLILDRRVIALSIGP